MNTLSFMLYLADILPSMSSLLFFVGASIFAGWLAYHTFTISHEGPFAHIAAGRYSLKSPVLSIAILALSSLIPSKETIYMIAASESAEFVVTTPEAKEIMSDIKAVIKQQLNDLKVKP